MERTFEVECPDFVNAKGKDGQVPPRHAQLIETRLIQELLRQDRNV